MSITILSRSRLLAEIGGKKLLVEGEATLDMAFYTDINSIKHWEPPFDGVLIDQEEKVKIMNWIIEESKKAGFKVVFD